MLKQNLLNKGRTQNKKFFLSFLFLLVVSLFMVSSVSAFDVSNYEYTGESLSLNPSDDLFGGDFFSPDGKTYIYGDNSDNLYELSCSTPYDLSTCSEVDTLTLSHSFDGFGFTEGGNRMEVTTDDGSENYRRYDCSTPYDLSTCSQNFLKSGDKPAIAGELGFIDHSVDTYQTEYVMLIGSPTYIGYYDGIDFSKINEYNPFGLDHGDDYTGVDISSDGDWVYAAREDETVESLEYTNGGLVNSPDNVVSKNISSEISSAYGVEISEDKQYLFIQDWDSNNLYKYEVDYTEDILVDDVYPSSGTDDHPLRVNLSVDTSPDIPSDYYDIRYYRDYDDQLLCEKTGVPTGAETECPYIGESTGEKTLLEFSNYGWYYEIDYNSDTFESGYKDFNTGTMEINTEEPDNVDFTNATLKGNLSDMYKNSTADLYFEYKKSTDSTWNKTPLIETVSRDNITYDFSYELLGLTDGINYDYRARSEYKYLNKTGDTKTFETNSTDPTVKDLGYEVNYSRAELKGNLTDLGIYDEVYTRFFYRQTGSDTWKNTEPIKRTSPTDFYETVDLKYDTQYEYKACADFDNTKECSLKNTFTTESPFTLEHTPSSLPTPTSVEDELHYDKLKINYIVSDIDPELDYVDFELTAVYTQDFETADDDDLYGGWEDEQTFKVSDEKIRVYPENVSDGNVLLQGYLEDLDLRGYDPDSSGKYYTWYSNPVGYLSNGDKLGINYFENSIGVKYWYSLDGKPIGSIESLFGIRSNVSETYYFTKNLDFCDENDYTDAYEGFVSINNFCESQGAENGYIPVEDEFNGKIDAEGHHIRNLYINRPNNTNTGLFSTIGNGEIYGLGVIDSRVTGGNKTGLISGTVNGNATFNNLFLQGTIKGDEIVGGFFGSVRNNHGGVNDSYIFGTVECSDICGMITGQSEGYDKFGHYSEYRNIYIVGDVFSDDFSDDGIFTGYAMNGSKFIDSFYNLELVDEYQTKVGKWDENLETILENTGGETEYDMKLSDTLESYNFDFFTVKTTDDRIPMSTWNLVEYSSYPFLSIQSEYIEFDELGEPVLLKEIPNFDMGFNQNFSFDLNEYFDYAESYKFKVGDEWFSEVNDLRTDLVHIYITDGRMYFETQDIPQNYDITVRAINGAGNTEDSFTYRILENPEKDFYRGDAEEPEGFITDAVNWFLDLFPDERQLTSLQKIGFTVLILLVVSGIVLGFSGISPTSLYITFFVDLIIFLFLASLGYVPTSFLIWIAVVLVVFGVFKLYKSTNSGGE